MFLSNVLVDVRSGRRRVGTFGALPLLLALVPFAYASPADPVWIAGVYDAADLDDAVQTARSLESQVQRDRYIISPVLAIERFVLATGSARSLANSYGAGERGPPEP